MTVLKAILTVLSIFLSGLFFGAGIHEALLSQGTFLDAVSAAAAPVAAFAALQVMVSIVRIEDSIHLLLRLGTAARGGLTLGKPEGPVDI